MLKYKYLPSLLVVVLISGCSSIGPNGWWYRIDKTGHFFKRSMLYNLTLITLLDSGDSQGGQVVITTN